MRIKKIHVSKQQITLLQQLQQRVKVSKSGLKCTRLDYPHLPHLPPVGTACQQMAAMPPSWSLLFHTWSLLLQMLTKTLLKSTFRSVSLFFFRLLLKMTIWRIVIFNNSLKKISETDRNVDFKYS